MIFTLMNHYLSILKIGEIEASIDFYLLTPNKAAPAST